MNNTIKWNSGPQIDPQIVVAVDAIVDIRTLASNRPTTRRCQCISPGSAANYVDHG